MIKILIARRKYRANIYDSSSSCEQLRTPLSIKRRAKREIPRMKYDKTVSIMLIITYNGTKIWEIDLN